MSPRSFFVYPWKGDEIISDEQKFLKRQMIGMKNSKKEISAFCVCRTKKITSSPSNITRYSKNEMFCLPNWV